MGNGTHSQPPLRSLLKGLFGGLLLALLLTVAPPPQASAQETLRAAAVVNDEVISELDLAMRTRLAIISSRLENTAETQQRLSGQVLRSLIDEKLQLQEATRLDITITDDELNGTIDGLAQQNQLTREQFFDVLRGNQILPAALREQVRGLLTWRKVIRSRVFPQIEVSEEEITAVIDRVKSSHGVEQVRVAEIFLALDDPSQENEVGNDAIRLLEQLRNGAQFSALAQQFSSSSTASVGGDLGWIEADQLSEDLAEAVARMKPGELAGPINTFGGFYILQLLDRRRISLGERILALQQVLFDVPENTPQEEQEAIRAQAQALSAEVKGCGGLAALAERLEAPTPFDLGEIKISDLPEATRAKVESLNVGEASVPIEIPEALTVLVVCYVQDEGLNRGDIRETLAQRRVEMRAQRYLRDLRRAANIDVRL